MKKEMKGFNIRVYGILINANQELLISDEQYKGATYTKFPGGGLCFGESMPAGLIREFQEECDLDIKIERLLHATETFVPSAFDDSQVIAVYYQVSQVDPDLKQFKMENVDLENNSIQTFRWVPLAEVKATDFDFEMDGQAWEKIIVNLNTPKTV